MTTTSSPRRRACDGTRAGPAASRRAPRRRGRAGGRRPTTAGATPSVAARQRSTPCQSGVAYASQRSRRRQRLDREEHPGEERHRDHREAEQHRQVAVAGAPTRSTRRSARPRPGRAAAPPAGRPPPTASAAPRTAPVTSRTARPRFVTSPCSQARAAFQSLMTVRTDTPTASAVSSTENPPKNRSSTTWLARGADSASKASASWRATTSTPGVGAMTCTASSDSVSPP